VSAWPLVMVIVVGFVADPVRRNRSWPAGIRNPSPTLPIGLRSA
jgi:hypothetical protein